MDTNPLAPQAGAILEGREEDLRSGLGALATLTPGPVFVCTDPAGSARIPDCGRARVVEFEGPHPAGLVGTHIHYLFPLGEAREVWYTGVQDALAIGRLCRTGSLDPERVIALAGPRVRRPRLLRTRLGASTEELVQGELEPGACRILAGSPLSGRRAASGGAFLGRFDEQLCVLPEEAEPGPEAWLVPEAGGARRFPPWRARPRWTGALHGRPRPLLPLDLFDRVVPLRLPLGLLLRSLAARHADGARSFGALELEEEDLALCTFLCASKLEYGPLLRAALGELESERP
jgi:Na+-transporting NADH:ubiquinone oxidoreductase subunit A